MINSSHTYHTPVLLKECIDALQIKPNGVYVDATFGGGGHSRPILDRMNAEGRLFGFDQDEQAQANVIEDSRFQLVHANFKYLEHFMRYYEVGAIHGLLADLGVSSFHFDEASRGFSYRFDTELDMRMNQNALISARDILASYKQEELQKMFSAYGEIRNARTLSMSIIETRKTSSIEVVSDLMGIIDKVYRGDKLKYMSQVFQALRIEVNDEIGVLESFLETSLSLLAKGGRLAVISYHSLEDKCVKKVFKNTDKSDEYGRRVSEFKIITKKPILPTDEEIEKNSRAASAKLRVIERL